MTQAPARSPSDRQLPVVEFADFAAGDAAARSAAAADIRRAFEETGALYLRHHGVPGPVLEALFAQARAFFALPLDAKNAVKPRTPGSTRGYEGVGIQALDEGQPGDLKEIFQVGGEEVWPADLPAFRDAVLAFRAAAQRTCNRVMAALALSLGLPEDYFEPFHSRAEPSVRMLHYPPLHAPPAPGQLRAGAHTDFGGLSLLFQDDAGGLEIQAADGTWIPAPALPDTAIVNTGDLIERWSNGLFRSSPHRVVNPEGAAASRDRYSVVLFHSPNRDAEIACLPPCQSPERPAQYPPVTAGEHIAARARASRGQMA
jgi:isopenicillin N synthase-like dioxygenase